MLEVQGLSMGFGGRAILSEVTFGLEEGEALAVVGPSGSGKTTLLRLLSGLENPDRGSVQWCGNDIIHKPPHQREMSIVFQSSALWPHMTLRGNIEAAAPKGSDQEVAQLLSDLELLESAGRRPHQVSGGQARRAAIARALASKKKILLMDEPFSSLGLDLAARTAKVIEAWTTNHRTTVIWTCHSTAAFPLRFDRSLELFEEC
jgi:iron(III) transport system ATP-binding protein